MGKQTNTRLAGRIIRHKRRRERLSGSPQRPRLSVFRSQRYIYVQIVDDKNGKVFGGASTVSKDFRNKYGDISPIEQAGKLGGQVAEKLKALGISQAIFDTGGHKYWGQVRAIADAVRKAGVEL
jgi:large subunit ribosomal protein L18